MDDTELLVTAVNSLKPLATVGIFVYVLLNRVFSFWDKRTARKSNKELDEAKAVRAEKFLQAMNNIAAKQEQTSLIMAENLGNMAQEISEVKHGVTTLTRTMADLRDRQARVISRSESLAIVEAKFNDYIRNEVIAVFDQSLRRNAYHERKNFVYERVQKALSDIVTHAHQSLERDYPGLDIDLTPFFTVRGNGNGATRYTIIDAMWEKAEPLYTGKGYKDIDQRVEDMRVYIATIVNDHVQSARASVTDLYANELVDSSSRGDQ